MGKMRLLGLLDELRRPLHPGPELLLDEPMPPMDDIMKGFP